MGCRTLRSYAAWPGAASTACSTASRPPRVATPAARKSVKGASMPSGKEGEERAGLPQRGRARHQGPGCSGPPSTSPTGGSSARAACRRRRGGGRTAMLPGTARPGSQESKPEGGSSRSKHRAMRTQGGQAAREGGAVMRRAAQQAWRAEMCCCQGRAPNPPSAGRPNSTEWCRPGKAGPVAPGARARSTSRAEIWPRRVAAGLGGGIVM